jgi:hypothetical protein
VESRSSIAGKEPIRKVARLAATRLSPPSGRWIPEDPRAVDFAPEKYNETPAINNASVATGAPYNSFLGTGANSPSPAPAASHFLLHTREEERSRGEDRSAIFARAISVPHSRLFSSLGVRSSTPARSPRRAAPPFLSPRTRLP